MIYQPIKSTLCWKLLNATQAGGVILECMAAASDDGIGVVARWTRNGDGFYQVEAMDTESGVWSAPEGDDDTVPVDPPFRLRAPIEVNDRAGRYLPFFGQLMGDWYESAPYGEQVPRDLPGLLVAFLRQHGKEISIDESWEIIDSPDDEGWLPIFESIFLEGAKYSMLVMANAVSDGNNQKLEAIDLRYAGVINEEAQSKEDGKACPYQHIMHPNFGGRKVFEEIPAVVPESTTPARRLIRNQG